MKTILTTVVAIAMSAIMLLTGIGPIAGNVDMGIGKENGVVYKTEDIDDFIKEEQTVESVEIITDFAGNRFKLYELSPTGYAIYSLQGEASIFIEGSYATNSPYYGAENGKYYLGIGEYFTETSARSKEVRSVVTGKTVEKEELLGATFAVDEKHYKVGEEIQATFPSTPDPSKTTTYHSFTVIDDYEYFTTLINFPLNNDGACGLVAICMLLGYFNNVIDSRFITDPTYLPPWENGGRANGTRNTLKEYLKDNCGHFIFVGENAYPMAATQIRDTVQDYLDKKCTSALRSRVSHVYGSITYTHANPKTHINGGVPTILVLVSYQEQSTRSNSESFHDVVAYGYDSNDRFMVHKGWYPGETTCTEIIIGNATIHSYYTINYT